MRGTAEWKNNSEKIGLAFPLGISHAFALLVSTGIPHGKKKRRGGCEVSGPHKCSRGNLFSGFRLSGVARTLEQEIPPIVTYESSLFYFSTVSDLTQPNTHFACTVHNGTQFGPPACQSYTSSQFFFLVSILWIFLKWESFVFFRQTWWIKVASHHQAKERVQRARHMLCNQITWVWSPALQGFLSTSECDPKEGEHHFIYLYACISGNYNCPTASLGTLFT